MSTANQWKMLGGQQVGNRSKYSLRGTSLLHDNQLIAHGQVTSIWMDWIGKIINGSVEQF